MKRLRAIAMVLGGLLAANEAQAQAAAPASRQISVFEQGGFAISGWRHRRGANDIHFFDCEDAVCKPGSKVSYRLYAAPSGTLRTLAQFRSEQEQVAKMLEERAGPGTRIEVLDVEGDDTGKPQFLRAVRVQTRSDGSREFVQSGIVSGTAAEASVISSAVDRETARDNYAQFMLPIALIVQGQIKSFAPEKK